MASPEDLRRIYSPTIFGNHFNKRPAPDALGRAPATPLDIQRAEWMFQQKVGLPAD